MQETQHLRSPGPRILELEHTPQSEEFELDDTAVGDTGTIAESPTTVRLRLSFRSLPPALANLGRLRELDLESTVVDEGEDQLSPAAPE